MKLEKLNNKQIKLMETVRDEWLGRIFVKRKPLQKKKAMALIHWLYEFSKLEKPLVIFVNSPMAMQIASNILNGNQVRNQVRNQVGDQVGDQVGNQVWDQVRNQVGNQVWNQVWNQVGNQVRNQVGNQVWDQVRNQVGDQVGNQVRAKKMKFYSFSSHGNIWDFSWLSFYDFFDRLGLDLVKHDNFNTFKELIQTNIYDMIQLDKYCIVCPLPEKLYRNDKQRLHCEDAPAISWKDGYAQHYLHGIYVPEELWEKIVDKTLSFKECMAIGNIEQRMVALKYLGADKLLEETKAKSIDKVRGYELFEVNAIFPTTQYFLKYQCPSTGRVYVSGIDPEVGEKKSAIDALAWKFYLDGYEKDTPLFNQES